MTEVSILDLRAEAEVLTRGLPAGDDLSPLAEALIRLAVSSSVTALQPVAIDHAIAAAFDSGATLAQVQEIIALTSGLGVHTLMMTARPVLEAAAARGLIDGARPLDAERQVLWDRHIGNDPFWTAFSAELPGFLDAMLRLSPDIFTGFFEYCAIPWQSGTVRAWIKELAALACDAAPSHRFRPGFRVHLRNAIALQIGRRAILQTLDIAAAAPTHDGTA